LTGNRVLAVFRDGAARLDLVPVDFVTEAAMRLLRDPRAAGRTYHLTAGRGHTVPVRRLIETAIGIAGDGAPGNLRFLGAGAPAPRRWRRMESFFAYLDCGKEFDDAGIRGHLGRDLLARRNPGVFLRPVFEFCAATGWGARLPWKDAVRAREGVR